MPVASDGRREQVNHTVEGAKGLRDVGRQGGKLIDDCCEGWVGSESQEGRGELWIGLNRSEVGAHGHGKG